MRQWRQLALTLILTAPGGTKAPRAGRRAEPPRNGKQRLWRGSFDPMLTWADLRA
jgi:hypothetical protein